jgi:hypothetical protein
LIDAERKYNYGMAPPRTGALGRLARRVLAAGVDLVLHCDCRRDFQDTLEILEAVQPISQQCEAILMAAFKPLPAFSDLDRDQAMAQVQAAFDYS